MHLKRNKSPKTWPIKRKGTKYVAIPMGSLKRGVPLIILLRDLLKLGDTRREIKRFLNQKKVLVNCRPVKEERWCLYLGDSISLENVGDYRVSYSEDKKFILEEIKNSETIERISKVSKKKVLSGGRMQVSFPDGRNLITDEKIKVGDSVVVDLKKNKIIKKITLGKGSEVLIIGGKHLGKKGKIKNLIDDKSALVTLGDKEIPLPLNKILVTK